MEKDTPVHFKSSLDHLEYLIQYKCYVSSGKYNVDAMQIVSSMWQIQVLLFGTFWNF